MADLGGAPITKGVAVSIYSAKNSRTLNKNERKLFRMDLGLSEVSTSPVIVLILCSL